MKKTFIVNILNDQNATWQGTVDWVGQKKTQSFRSALELLRLLDSAMGEAKPPEWEAAAE